MPGVVSARDLLAALVRAPSVTPDAEAALDVVQGALAPAGFMIERPAFGEGAARVENLFAALGGVAGGSGPHVAFAGHVDVVPPGDTQAWRHPPFAAVVEEGDLYGRGAADMKGGLAAMMAAATRFAARRGPDFGGRLSFLVTGDEEGPGVNGTARLLEWAAARGERFTAAIVGEPTSAVRVGDQVKIGRRGSYSATLAVTGRQGHAAYPQLAVNPIRGLTAALTALQAPPLDEGTDRFEPSTLEIVSVDTDNPAWNVIPGRAAARLNSRFNDRWSRATLRAEIEGRVAAAMPAEAQWTLDEEPAVSDVFLTEDAALIERLSVAIEAETGLRPALSTGGGTSDARFIKDYCPVVEFGPVGTTMHQVDERVSLADIERLSRIYEAFLDAAFA